MVSSQDKQNKPQTRKEIASREHVVAEAAAHQDDPPYDDCKIGDTIRGERIEYIYHVNSRFLIFRDASGELRYRVQPFSPRIPIILTAFNEAWIEARDRLRGAYHKDLLSLFVMALNSSLLSTDDEPDLYLRPVRTFIKERGPIEYVYGHGQHFIVYLNNQKVIAFEYDTLPNTLIPAVTEFYRLQHVAMCALTEEDRERVASILGMDLVTVFRSSDATELSQCFLSSKEFITNRSEAVLRSQYVRSSVLSSTIVLAVLAITTLLLRKYSLGAWVVTLGSIGGVIGATISIIQRGVSLKVNPFVPLAHVVFQGTIRVILGIIFGALLVAAAKAGIALGILAGNTWSLFVFCVVAGFSERFVPDILDRIAVEQQGRSKLRKRKSE